MDSEEDNGWLDGDEGPKPLVVHVQRGLGRGCVRGIKNKALADPVELERQVLKAEWGPILDLPVYRSGYWIRPDIDEDGRFDWGAFDTADFERLYGSFDKVRYKVDKLHEELRWAMARMEVAAGRVAKGMIYPLIRNLRSGAMSLEHIDDMNQYFFAQRFLRVLSINNEIGELRARRRAAAVALVG